MLRPIIALACVAAAAASARVALLAPLTNGTHLYGGGYWKSAVAAMAQSCDDFNARDASVVEAYGNCSNATLMLDCEAFDTRVAGQHKRAKFPTSKAHISAVFDSRGDGSHAALQVYGAAVFGTGDRYEFLAGPVTADETVTLGGMSSVFGDTLLSYADEAILEDDQRQEGASRGLVGKSALPGAVYALYDLFGWEEDTSMVFTRDDDGSTLQAAFAGLTFSSQLSDDYTPGVDVQLTGIVRAWGPLQAVVFITIGASDLPLFVETARAYGFLDGYTQYVSADTSADGSLDAALLEYADVLAGALIVSQLASRHDEPRFDALASKLAAANASDVNGRYLAPAMARCSRDGCGDVVVGALLADGELADVVAGGYSAAAAKYVAYAYDAVACAADGALQAAYRYDADADALVGPLVDVVYMNGASTPVTDGSEILDSCATDEFYNATAHACEACAAGAAVSDDGSGCDVCSAGTYGLSGLCVPCTALNEYGDTAGASACASCPANTYRARSTGVGRSASECRCYQNYVSSSFNASLSARDESFLGVESTWGDVGVACLPCPDGATCPGERAPPNNKRGYYGDPWEPTEFYDRCDACDTHYACSDGWEGAMCKTVKSPDFFTVSELGPWRCPDSKAYRALNVLGGVACVVFLWLYVNENLLDAYPSLDLLTYFMQLVAIICRYRFAHFPTGIGPYAVVLDVALFDIDVFRPTCVMEWNFRTSVIAQIFVVAAGALTGALPIAASMARKLRRERSYRSFTAVRKSLHFYGGAFGARAASVTAGVGSLIMVQHTTFTFNAFAALRCESFVGRPGTYFREDPTRRCDTFEGHALTAVSVATLAVLARLGWAFGAFRSPHHGWLIRRVWLTIWVCAVATLVDNPLLQICFTLVVLLHAYSEHCAHQPYHSERLNTLETCGLAWTATTVTTAILLQDGKRWVKPWFALLLAGQVALFLRVLASAAVESMNRRSSAASVAELRKRVVAARAAAVGGAPGTRRAAGPRERPLLSDPSLRHLQDSAAHLVANLVGAEDDSLDGDAKAAVDALGELTNGLHPVAWRAWVAQDAPGDLELASGVAGALATIIGDESSFTSVYSSDARSAYWKTLAARFPGMIDFAANMDGGERVVFFGALARLQRYVKAAGENPAAAALHHLVDERDRASVLYFLCACGEEDHARLVALLRQVVARLKAARLPRWKRELFLPYALVRAVSRRDSVQRRASRALAAAAVDAGDLLFDVDDVAGAAAGLAAHFDDVEDQAANLAAHALDATPDEHPPPEPDMNPTFAAETSPVEKASPKRRKRRGAPAAARRVARRRARVLETTAQ
ncbi:hypothetical protein JL721_6899 [Aureococcus anophagefferens]|nr:hypothetical protein JL721_6899 [Aureococcus anophagefferens]